MTTVCNQANVITLIFAITIAATAIATAVATIIATGVLMGWGCMHALVAAFEL